MDRFSFRPIGFVVVLLVAAVTLLGGVVEAQEASCSEEACSSNLVLCKCCPQLPRTILISWLLPSFGERWERLHAEALGICSDPPPEGILHVPRTSR